jgi:dTDP-L-rhamnose 4-epimerase
MRIVITGGLGFIGTALARHLVEDDHSVLLVDNLSAQVHGALPVVDTPRGARVQRADMRGLAQHHEMFEGCDVVYHLAAETGTAQSMYRIEDYVQVNCGGTAALLQAIAKCTRRPRQVVLGSSRSVYGEGAYVSPAQPHLVLQPAPRTKEQMQAGQWEPIGTNATPLQCVATPESLPFAPGSVYAATKAAQELLLTSAATALSLRATIFRFHNVYGEGQSLQNPYTGIISIFFNRARQGLDIPIYEDGFESRDFVHVSDVVATLQAALHADVPSGMPINLGAGQPTTVAALAEALLRVSGFTVPTRVTGQFRVGDIRHCFADITRARELLGYSPKVSLDEGLARFCAWAARQPIHEDRLVEVADELRRQGLGS